LQVLPIAHADGGNASVCRIGNLQFFQMTPSVHPPGNASVCRIGNLQFFQMTPTGPLSVQISSFTSTDLDGNQKTSFTPGDTIMLKAVISDNGSQNIPNALVSMMIQDPGQTPVFLSYTYQNLQAGQQTTVYLGFQIPYEPILGDYTAKLNIFTLLPSQGGQGILGGHAEVDFTVS
jgi:hypothetical protein